MDWAGLFLKPRGRIGRGAFWLGFAMLAALQGAACLAPRVGWFAFMLLAYSWVCLYAKRLHDIGRSGWLTLAPVLVTLFGLSAAAAFWVQSLEAKEGAWLYVPSVGALAIASGIDLLFVVWVGLCPSEADENPYGPSLHHVALSED